MKRPTLDEYYIEIAKAVAGRFLRGFYVKYS